MVQPPSKQLQQILLGKKLCTPRDLKRCVRRVKRLTADLPAFDSVWLDALVKTRKLTSFQAQTIETGMTDLLTIGPGIVLEQIGSGPAAATYLVRIPEAQVPAVIKRIPVATELKTGTQARFRELAQRGASVANSAIVIPHACHEIARSAELRRKASGTEKGVSPSRRRSRAASSNELVCELAVASRLVEGLSLSQMLLRRGRFPASVVQEIARQLLESLAALDAAGIVHGEILTDNVLIDGKGRAILVDAGVRPCVQPEFSFSAAIDPQRYSGIAPELIGTAQQYSHRSDLYALGCLLWELLTARPVFASGDPLARLAEHQTARVPDVREIAPDTPTGLAEAILWLTEPSADRRPRSAAEVLGRGATGFSKRTTDSKSDRPSLSLAVGQASKGETLPTNDAANSGKSPVDARGRKPRTLSARSCRRSLTKFSSAFNSRPLGRTKQRRENARFVGHIAAACLVVLVASGALLTLHGQSREWVTTAIAASVGGDVRRDGSDVPAHESTVTLQAQGNSALDVPRAATPLPQPDASGVITLDDAGPWLVESLLWGGQRLTIRGPENGKALLVVNRPVRVRASEIAIEHVELRFEDRSALPVAAVSEAGSPAQDDGSDRPAVPLLEIQSRVLSISDCAFLSGEGQAEAGIEGLSGNPEAASGTRSPSSLSEFVFIWSPLNPRDSLPGEINVENTRLIGERSSIGLAGPRHLVRFRNVLQSGPGALFVVAQSQIPGRHDLQLQHCTLRNSGGLFEARLGDGKAWKSQVRLKLVACVFDFSGQESAGSGALVRFRADELTPRWHETLVINGRDSIARPDLRLVELFDGRNREELDASSVMLNGLVGATFEFRAPDSDGDFSDSILTSHDASLVKTERPGVGVSRETTVGQEQSLSADPVLKTGGSLEVLQRLPAAESEVTR